MLKSLLSHLALTVSPDSDCCRAIFGAELALLFDRDLLATVGASFRFLTKQQRKTRDIDLNALSAGSMRLDTARDDVRRCITAELVPRVSFGSCFNQKDHDFFHNFHVVLENGSPASHRSKGQQKTFVWYRMAVSHFINAQLRGVTFQVFTHCLIPYSKLPSAET